MDQTKEDIVEELPKTLTDEQIITSFIPKFRSASSTLMTDPGEDVDPETADDDVED